jgi:uridine kinase
MTDRTCASGFYARLCAEVLTARPLLGATRLVVVDGPAGSGKTTFAARLAAAAGAPVVHLDDLYEGWTGLEPGLWQRLRRDLLDPLSEGRAGRYQRYDWSAGRFAEWHDVPPVPVLVLEGVGSAARCVDALASLRVWVEVPADLRLARGLHRDGPASRPQWVRWMELERGHFAADRTRDRADVVVDGADPAYAAVEDGRAG